MLGGVLGGASRAVGPTGVPESSLDKLWGAATRRAVPVLREGRALLVRLERGWIQGRCNGSGVLLGDDVAQDQQIKILQT